MHLSLCCTAAWGAPVGFVSVPYQMGREKGFIKGEFRGEENQKVNVMVARKFQEGMVDDESGKYHFIWDWKVIGNLQENK